MLKNIKGTKFQLKVWNEILKVPKGSTKTYKEIAIAIGHPNSYRAVANSCSKNPLLLIIPCHRVIRNDGKISGYRGKKESKLKKKLLNIEKRIKKYCC